MTISPDHQAHTSRFTTHIHQPEHLLSFAGRSTTPTDLVATPVQFHQRNLTRRLALRNQPRSSLQIRSPTQIARDILTATSGHAQSLDRLDRIRALETLLETEPDSVAPFIPLYGSSLAAHAPEIETSRRALEAITAYDDTRLATLKELCQQLPAVARRDAIDRINGAKATHDRLSERSDVAVSPDALLSNATTALRHDGTAIWNHIAPDIQRLHLAGVSSIEAPLREFLSALATETPVDVHLFLRAGTGPRIDARLRDRPPTDHLPITSQSSHSPALDVPATELVTTTPNKEARLALALADQLLTRGVSPSDILLVARDVTAYEHHIQRAADHYGHSVSVWTQLPVTETAPYRLIDSLCVLLAHKNDTVSPAQLFRPLAFEWVPPGSAEWQLTPHILSSLENTLHEHPPLELDDWHTTLLETDTHTAATAAVHSLIEWVQTRPQSPTPADLTDTFDPLIDTYREVILPAHRTRDTHTLADTTETARACVRLEDMVPEVATKYEHWLDRNHSRRSWEEVRSLFDTIATVKPGRREHANAAVLDLVDATDTWLRQVPYIIALGLTDRHWPQTPDGLFPVEMRELIHAGQSHPARTLAPLERWSQAREFDHFVDAISTATHHLLCTRPTQDADGLTLPRSPFLDTIDTTRIAQPATDRLLSTHHSLPQELATAFPTEENQ